MTRRLASDLATSRDTLLAAASALPRRDQLTREIADAEAAQARGYYLPDEDERLREVFARYLELRTALRTVVARMEPWVDRGEELDKNLRLSVFLVGFTAACFLVRSGIFIINMASEHRVVRRKLDEAEPRYGIPRKTFTEVYRLQSSVRRMWKFHEAWQFYQKHRTEVLALRSDSALGPVAVLLEEEEPFMETRRRAYWHHRIHYRLHSFRRRHRQGFEQTMFHIFELGGRTVAELRDPFAGLFPQPKRALRHCELGHQYLEPGDILITRHRDALSNRFLPGFWPHAALHVGALGDCEGQFVEARKDGVRLRPMEDTLAVDSALVLRARLPREIREEAARRALTHVGKLYDFAFDFRQATRLACTALVYRSWHGLGGIRFELGAKAGRLCLSAEDLITQSLAHNDFEVVAYFGPRCESVSLGKAAAEQFHVDREQVAG
ncbi:YiiX/YebB-like N1pC/P60 family cysteine hydrolase [Roseibacillus ishigakijimensis]|uniref:Permuted papain-like amidase enzyme, YaeF/YiiX, C92 family n=1 Tax=Roseibacillus ishigakijimensis TaxID=454146 RepID=A0A934VN00_9BACT|nr:YiiX/YebB-like N1pC/P60 family cysteine hydrolase [Roseibacillus ishigakijimensis]MBK1834616.1 hypothetical protein [Roseibacillus ishigakijimensis]